MHQGFLRSGILNMAYKVKFTEKCLEDIEEICAYISEMSRICIIVKKII